MRQELSTPLSSHVVKAANEIKYHDITLQMSSSYVHQ